MALAAVLACLVACKKDEGEAEGGESSGAVVEGSAAVERGSGASAGAGEATEDGAPEAGAQAARPPRQPVQQPLPQVQERGQAETEQELLEIRRRLGIEPLPPLPIGDLMSRADIREITQYEGPLAETNLPGVEPEPTYNSMRIATPDGYGFGLQVWELVELRQLQPKFERLQATYLNAEALRGGVGDRAFAAEFDGIRSYALMDRRSRMIAVITCQSELCDRPQIRQLAERVHSRL